MKTMRSGIWGIICGLLFGLAWPAAASEKAGSAEKIATATFAGGCFWCMVHPFDELPGVISVTSGYTGGHTPNPTYAEVSSHTTGHIEAVQIRYDPDRIQYQRLLEVYWRNVDPLDRGGQFCDRGDTYQSAIFYQGEEEKRLAEQSKAEIERRLQHQVVTEIRPADRFYAAEDYHQNFYKKNPLRYTYYRYRCGRDQRLDDLWGKKS